MESPWTLEHDFVICGLILQHGYENVVPSIEWVEKMFTPLPTPLLGRTFSEIVQRLETLQPLLLEFLKSRKSFTGAELFTWLSDFFKEAKKKDFSEGTSTAEPPLKRERKWKRFSFEEDFCICREVVKAVFEQRVPHVFGQQWFRLNLMESGLLVSRSSNSLYERFRWHLKSGIFESVERARALSVSLHVPLSLELLEESVLQWLRLLHFGLEELVADDQTSAPPVHLKVIRPIPLRHQDLVSRTWQ